MAAVEIICLVCDGGGLVPDSASLQTFKVRLCVHCNGHGVVLIDDKFPRLGLKYAPTKGAQCRFEN